jgi:outer membrane protein assembly factor BamE (lipoprotein component of BamABCDE complex)
MPSDERPPIPPAPPSTKKPGSRHKRLLLLVLTTLAGTAVFLAVWWSASAHAITPENVARIKPGMTRAELVALMGAPPGSYDGAVFQTTGSTIVSDDDPDVWVSRRAAVKVFFDDDQRVTLMIHGQSGVREGWFARCRRWLGL